MKWRVVLERDESTGEWAVWCPELPGCATAGATEEEALANIKEAIELYLEPDALPFAPQAVVREVYDIDLAKG
ncbi:MAG TPA: type II toxin-antitoxin system HicB family antitoxin [Pyrinomonadaceae bacterium]|nr:type II toxin-antitoxin system HicB family antitoxin [Pyrinomonadaceae bacterium]